MRNRAFRLLAVGFAAASLVAATGTPAFAAPKVSCAKATFKTDLKKGTSISKMTSCTNPAVSGGGGTIVANFKDLKKITAKITWNAGKGTTSYKVAQKGGPAAQNKCHIVKGKHELYILSTGTFTAGTGKAGTALKGLKYIEKLCVRSDSSTYLMPGSSITFG